METCANDSLFLLKSLKGKKKASSRTKKKSTNRNTVYIHFLSVLHWVEKLPNISILWSSVSYWSNTLKVLEILVPAFVCCEIRASQASHKISVSSALKC